jgi:hypothetical protein
MKSSIVALCLVAGFVLVGSGCTNSYCKAQYDYCIDCTNDGESDCSSALDDCQTAVGNEDCGADDLDKLASVGDCIESNHDACNNLGYLGCLMSLSGVDSDCLYGAGRATGPAGPLPPRAAARYPPAPGGCR